jgi:hypothetical protein
MTREDAAEVIARDATNRWQGHILTKAPVLRRALCGGMGGQIMALWKIAHLHLAGLWVSLKGPNGYGNAGII